VSSPLRRSLSFRNVGSCCLEMFPCHAILDDDHLSSCHGACRATRAVASSYRGLLDL
jgi:hypothetical protein